MEYNASKYFLGGLNMCRPEYDLTYDDLNPTFLFFCELKRTESENNYHCHEHIELSIVKKGHCTFYIDGKEYPVKQGDLIILNPGVYHKSLYTCPGDSAVEYYIAFSDLHLRDLPPNTFPLPGGNVILPMKEVIRQEVFRICASMGKEFQAYRPGRYFMLKAYLIQLILQLLREQKEAAEGIKNTKGCIFESPNKKYVVNQMIRYFNEHYQEKISLDRIARNMYLRTFYLSKIFKSETGDTPINYLIELRMEKARELLEAAPGLSIQNVAEMVGYDDAYHFSKLFKKHYGEPPTKYKRS